MRKRGGRIAGDIQNAIVGLAVASPDWSAGQVLDALQRDRRFAGRTLPTDRTVRTIVARLRTLDTSGPWALRDADPEDVAFLLDVLREVMIYTDGQVRSLTRAVADLAVRIHAARPPVHGDLRPWDYYLFARYYQVAEAQGWEPAAIDAYLAFAPWRSAAAAREYAQYGGPAPWRFVPPIEPGEWWEDEPIERTRQIVQEGESS